MKKQNDWSEVDERFDEKFVWPDNMVDHDADDIKSFWHSELEKVRQEAEDNMRKRCVEALPKDTSDYIEELGLTIENPSKKEFLYQATQNINNLDKGK